MLSFFISSLGDTKCDMYVKILIGGDSFQTTVMQDNHFPEYYETIDINGVRKTDNITLQLWDSDNHTEHDLLWEWKMTINDLFKDSEVSYRKDTDLFIISYCVNWYNDDETIQIQKCPESK